MIQVHLPKNILTLRRDTDGHSDRLVLSFAQRMSL